MIDRASQTVTKDLNKNIDRSFSGKNSAYDENIALILGDKGLGLSHRQICLLGSSPKTAARSLHFYRWS